MPVHSVASYLKGPGLGREWIGIVLGNREFVGQTWLKWLKDSGLNFVMRLPRHHLLTDAHD